jgi:quinol monooxygenase YgiN
MTIGVSATLKVLPGKNHEFETVFKQLMNAVNANEEGCLFYALHQSREDTQTYIVLEQYANEAALQAHGKTDHYRTLSKELAGCMAAVPELVLMDSI